MLVMFNLDEAPFTVKLPLHGVIATNMFTDERRELQGEMELPSYHISYWKLS